MPAIIPGVTATPQDLSDIIRLNTSMIQAMKGEFEKGPDDEPILVNSKTFQNYFGSVANAPDKQSYISATQMLKEAESIQIINITKDAEYGGLLIHDSVLANPEVETSVGDEIVASSGRYIGANSGVFNVKVTTAGAYAGTGEVTIYFTPTGESQTTVGTYNPIDATAFALENGVLFTLSDGGDNTLTLNDEWSVRVISTGTIPFVADEGVTTKESYTFTSTITDEGLGTGDGSTLTFSGTLKKYPIVPESMSITYTITTLQTAVDDGKGNISGTGISSGSINYETGVWTITYSTAPDDTTAIEVDYTTANYLAVLIARSKKSWSDNIGIQITSVDTTYNTFKIAEYEKNSDGDEILINTYEVSRDADGENGFGKPIYINDIFENESYLFYAINNTAITNTYISAVTSSIVYSDGGDDGSTPTPAEHATGVQAFNSPSIAFDLFVGAGETEKTVIDEIVTLVNTRYKEAYVDTTSGAYDSIISWVNTTLNIDAMRLNLYTPNQYMSYNGREYLCPASALAAMKRAAVVKSGQPFMPPAGIGEDRGSINSIRSERYFTDTEIELLHGAEVNVIKYFDSYGHVIFSDFTSQKRLSSTSYQSSVSTLNNMITEFQNALLVLNFKAINNQLFMQLDSLIDGYLKQLIQYNGTIESDYTISFDRNDDVTKDNGQVLVDVIFIFANLAREIKLKLVYTTNAMYSEVVGA